MRSSYKLREDSSTAMRPIEPGSTIGIFGGGQLGRMLTHVAQRLGYRVVIFTPEIDAPASQAANESIVTSFEDLDAVDRFARMVDCVTLEFENVSLAAVARAEAIVPVRPGSSVLRIAQHRFREKSTLRNLGFPVTPFVEIHGNQDFSIADQQLGWPMILKTSSSGYDGKGQRRVATLSQALNAYQELGMVPLIAEKVIDFSHEVSVLAARNVMGEIAVYPLLLNEHAHHILDVTQCELPSQRSPEMQKVALDSEEIARGVVQQLAYVGLLCIEFFVARDGSLLINEIAPRPHNSGHLTIEACRTSQFEQQLRAACNLPLGDTSQLKAAAMANLLGDTWRLGTPRFHVAMQSPQCYLHLYGKHEPNPSRKMGHITCLADSADDAAAQARAIRKRMSLDTLEVE